MDEATHVAVLNNPQRIAVTFVARGEIELLEPLTYTRGDGRTFTVPAHFRCNGASVPAVLWAVFSHPYAGSTLRAAIGHDWCCRVRTDSQSFVSRWFYRQLRADGSGRFRSWCYWAAVRWFGPRW